MRNKVIRIVAFIVFYQCLTISFPYFSGFLIDLLIHKDWEKYNLFLLFFAFIPLFQGLLEWLKAKGITVISEEYAASKRTELLRKLFAAPITFFSNAKTGVLLTKFTDDIKQYVDHMKLRFELVEHGFTFALIIIILGSKSLMLLLLVLACGLIFIIQSKVIAPYIHSLSSTTMRTLENSNEYLQERIQIIPLTRITGKYLWELERYKEILNEEAVNHKKMNRITFWNETTSALIRSIITGVIYLFCGWLLVQNAISLGDIVLSVGYYFILVGLLANTLEWTKRIKKYQISRLNVEELESLEPDTYQHGNLYESAVENIDFNEVTFSYPEKQPVLRGVSFSMKKGEVTAIVGISGGGKSTIAELMLKLYPVQSGTITINSKKNIEEMDGKVWRENISYASQDIFFFTRTIEDNLLYSSTEENKGKMLELSKEVGLHNIIDKRKDGYLSVMNIGANHFSGGQKQRLSLIRALLKEKPAIRIFDEPTSALDYLSETAVMREIYRNKEDAITVIIAHRLSTIRNADQIIVLHDGKIVERGNHKELMLEEGMYFNLYKHENAQ
ncbi:putative ABC transporter ATP-binding protein [compost metagenome]